MALLDCRDVATYLLAKQEDETGDISNLKLQKLLYYAQGLSLALHGQPLFKEPIQAWEHGPVVPAVYHAYKQYKAAPIPLLATAGHSPFADHITELLDMVYADYGQYSAWKLVNMTHLEPPWRDARDAGEEEISLAAMERHFRRQLSIHERIDPERLRLDSLSLEELAAGLG